MRTLVLLRLGFILFHFSVGKKAKAATPTRGSIRFFAKDMRLLGSHEGTIIIVTPRQFTQQSNFAAAARRSRITFNFLCSSYCNHFEINDELNEEALLFAHLFNCSESNVKSRYTPTHDSIQKLVSFFHFYLLGAHLYIYSNAKQEKSNLDLNTSKKEGHDDKIQVYSSLLRTSHGFVMKNTSVRASYINFFLAF